MSSLKFSLTIDHGQSDPIVLSFPSYPEDVRALRFTDSSTGKLLCVLTAQALATQASKTLSVLIQTLLSHASLKGNQVVLLSDDGECALHIEHESVWIEDLVTDEELVYYHIEEFSGMDNAIMCLGALAGCICEEL